ncbi:hypothetical protein MMC09_001532 [Bachmanniomyces sp. S44760]|nr:hypothetical protein [Bachmanniomyces sp. S44760]
MKTKKRVLCVYDGDRRLAKDEMMLNHDNEVRVSLGDGKAYLTDLDFWTMKRAEAFHDATPEEKGPWDQSDVDIPELMKA